MPWNAEPRLRRCSQSDRLHRRSGGVADVHVLLSQTKGIQMKDDLTWRFDVAVMEWLIVLAMLVILAVVGAMVTRRSLKASRNLRRVNFCVNKVSYLQGGNNWSRFIV